MKKFQLLNLYTLIIVFFLILLNFIILFYLWDFSNLYSQIISLNHLFNSPILLIISFFIIFIIGLILHEAIHGISWSFFCKDGYKSIKYGIMWKKMMPYCHCKEALKRNQYIIGAAMPLILLGIIPMVISFYFNNFFIYIFGFTFIVGAVGDIIIIYYLLKENPNSYILDNNDTIGYTVL